MFRLLLTVLTMVAPVSGQPSGGPYGPIDRHYEIPKAPHVYYVAPNGKSDSPGTSLAQPTTIEAVTGSAGPGSQQ